MNYVFKLDKRVTVNRARSCACTLCTHIRSIINLIIVYSVEGAVNRGATVTLPICCDKQFITQRMTLLEYTLAVSISALLKLVCIN